MNDIKVVHRLFILIIIPLLAMLGLLAMAIAASAVSMPASVACTTTAWYPCSNSSKSAISTR